MASALDLQAFLARERLEVVDIVRGAAPGTRRLVVGDRGTRRVRNVVALASDAAGAPAVETEARHLRELGRRLRPRMRATVPSVVEQVTVGDAVGTVLSAVAWPERRRTESPSRNIGERASAVLEWLMMLWDDTAGPQGSVDLGREANDTLLSMLAGSRHGAETLGALYRSRLALSSAQTSRTATHGCLCPHHVRIADGHVIGVDDWGLSRFEDDPLRDLGTWVVTTSGPGIGLVLAGRSRSGRTLRTFVMDGLAHWGMSPALWRDVLVLSLAEAAVTGLAQDDSAALDLLAGISHELSHDNGKE